jgi:hypothetical protein
MSRPIPIWFRLYLYLSKDSGKETGKAESAEVQESDGAARFPEEFRELVANYRNRLRLLGFLEDKEMRQAFARLDRSVSAYYGVRLRMRLSGELSDLHVAQILGEWALVESELSAAVEDFLHVIRSSPAEPQAAHEEAGEAPLKKRHPAYVRRANAWKEREGLERVLQGTGVTKTDFYAWRKGQPRSPAAAKRIYEGIDHHVP